MTITRHIALALASLVSALVLSIPSSAIAGWTDPVVVDTSPPFDDNGNYFNGEAESLALGMTPEGILRVVRAGGRGTWARRADQNGPITPQESLNYGDFPLGAFGASLQTEWLSSASSADGTVAVGLPYRRLYGNSHPGGFEGWKISPSGSPDLVIQGNRNWSSTAWLEPSVALGAANTPAAAWSESIADSSADSDQCRVLFSSAATYRRVLATYDHSNCGAVSVTSLAGGAWLVAWVDGRWGPDDVSKINLVRVAADGSFRELLFLPTMVSGRVGGGERSGLPLVSTTDGDALLAWRDDRGVVTLPISASGTVGSVDIVTRDAGIANLSLSSGAGGKADPILAWSTGDGTTTKLHVARLTSSGSARWVVTTPEVRGIIGMDATGTPGGRAVLTWRSRNLRDRNRETIRAAEISSLGYLNRTEIVGSASGGGATPRRVVRLTSSTANHVAIAWSDWEAINASWDGYIFPAPDPRPANCPDVYSVGVRGSRGDRDPNPMDEPFDPRRTEDDVIKAFTERLKDRTGLDVEPRWIRYPAAPATNALHSYRDWFRTGEYNSSVDDGIGELKARLTDLQRPGGCVSHGTQVVLAGYSQGAQVIGRAVDDGMNMAGVKAVSLFGDPTFSVDHSGHATYTSTLGIAPTGVLGGRTKDFPDNVFVTSFCRPHDFVCDILNGTFNVCTPLNSPCEPFPQHVRYKDPVVVGSGPFWSYDEKTLPPPPVQSADKVATQVLSVQRAATRSTSSGETTPQRQSISARAEPNSTEEPPVVVLPSRINLRPNQPVVLSGGLSYDPAGTMLLYEWDLDGDGRYDDQASLIPSVEASFATTPASPVRLRVTNELGLQSTADLVVDVSPAGSSRPGAPTSVRGTPGPRSVTLVWDLPTDEGSLPITGYLVRDGITGDLVGFADSSHVTITALTPGIARSFRVAARNDAGQGLSSAPSASVTPYEEDSSPAPSPPTPSLDPPSGGSIAKPPALPEVTSTPGPGQLASGSSFSVKLESGPLRRSQLGGRPTFTVRCQLSHPGTCSVKAAITRRVARRLGIEIHSKAIVVARGKTTLHGAGWWKTIRMRSTRQFRSAVRTYRRNFKIRLSASGRATPGQRHAVVVVTTTRR